ncbi:MAG: WD40 repeat domain-containing protein [Myxococcota bacterium]
MDEQRPKSSELHGPDNEAHDAAVPRISPTQMDGVTPRRWHHRSPKRIRVTAPELRRNRGTPQQRTRRWQEFAVPLQRSRELTAQPLGWRQRQLGRPEARYRTSSPNLQKAPLSRSVEAEPISVDAVCVLFEVDAEHGKEIHALPWSTMEDPRPVLRLRREDPEVRSAHSRWMPHRGIALGLADGGVLYTHPAKGSIASPQSSDAQPVHTVSLCPEGQFVACTRGNTAEVWNTNSMNEPVWQSGLWSSGGECTSVAFSPDGSRLALADRALGQVVIWRRIRPTVLDYEQSLPCTTAVSTDSFSKDGKLLAVGDKNVARVWDLEASRALFDDSTSSEHLEIVRLSPEEAYLITLGTDGLLRTLETGEGAQIQELETSGRPVHAEFSVTDDSFVLVSPQGGVQVFSFGNRPAAERLTPRCENSVTAGRN